MSEERTPTKGRLLVVDDEQPQRQMLQSILERAGFEVCTAGDGKAALTVLAEQSFDLLLTDQRMPEMDGLELLRTVRQSLSTQSLPVIVLTGSSNPRDELEVLETGADDFLLKPIEVDRLEARVRAVLRRAGVRIAHASE